MVELKHQFGLLIVIIIRLNKQIEDLVDNQVSDETELKLYRIMCSQPARSVTTPINTHMATSRYTVQNSYH